MQRTSEGWHGIVSVEPNPRARHALLQEDGFTDRSGREHPGRRFLKEALYKMRID
ncbi:hypothetical protein [Streptomyces buecherae]|uniref:hypothetical protein n=1 Tax=Streptomyces buecherae TaxID=2763006 RepID=UPI00164E9124|nr:hypothetical protein [Streptomyces buecherae]QNJ42024.1 hypothetical protein H7H31_21345 [Streptomyces buecherae]